LCIQNHQEPLRGQGKIRTTLFNFMRNHSGMAGVTTQVQASMATFQGCRVSTAVETCHAGLRAWQQMSTVAKTTSARVPDEVRLLFRAHRKAGLQKGETGSQGACKA
jgi:hypothetical protein